MKLAMITSTLVLCSVTACTFFQEPVEDLRTINAPSSATPVTAQLPSVSAPTAPPAQTTGAQRSVAAAPADGNYLTVSTIFDVPENVANLSFVHFTKRSRRREGEICQALLNTYPITRPTDVPANAANVIIWPITEGSTADNCSAMIKDHEPLDISSQTAEVVTSNSTGPFVLSRNTPQQKQMIYNFSSVRTSNLGSALTEWQQVVSTDVQSWPPIVNAQ